jgi:hypothetical protein
MVGENGAVGSTVEVTGVLAATEAVTAGNTVEGAAVAVTCTAGAAWGDVQPAANGRSIISVHISGTIRGTRCLPKSIGLSGILELFGSNLVILVLLLAPVARYRIIVPRGMRACKVGAAGSGIRGQDIDVAAALQIILAVVL